MKFTVIATVALSAAGHAAPIRTADDKSDATSKDLETRTAGVPVLAVIGAGLATAGAAGGLAGATASHRRNEDHEDTAVEKRQHHEKGCSRLLNPKCVYDRDVPENDARLAALNTTHDIAATAHDNATREGIETDNAAAESDNDADMPLERRQLGALEAHSRRRQPALANSAPFPRSELVSEGPQCLVDLSED